MTDGGSGHGAAVVRALGPGDLRWAAAVLDEGFGGRLQVRRREVVDALAWPGWVAERDGVAMGLLTFAARSDEWELVIVVSLEPRRGVGTLLVHRFLAEAGVGGARRVWLRTTNDNTGALAFYQRLGFRLVEVDLGAVDDARHLKAGLPELGAGGVPMRDELELELG